MKKLILVWAIFFFFPAITQAHSGGTNADGCHTNKKTGEYHCHNPKLHEETEVKKTKEDRSDKKVYKIQKIKTNSLEKPGASKMDTRRR